MMKYTRRMIATLLAVIVAFGLLPSESVSAYVAHDAIGCFDSDEISKEEAVDEEYTLYFGEKFSLAKHGFTTCYPDGAIDPWIYDPNYDTSDGKYVTSRSPLVVSVYSNASKYSPYYYYQEASHIGPNDKEGWTNVNKCSSTEKYHYLRFLMSPAILSEQKMSLGVGESRALDLTTNNQGKITWKSSNKKIATVDKHGKVTGKKTGTCTITATYMGYDYTCEVRINKVKTTTHTKNLAVGKTTTLKVKGATIKSYKVTYLTKAIKPSLKTTNVDDDRWAENGKKFYAPRDLGYYRIYNSDFDHNNKYVKSITVDKHGKVTAKKPGVAIVTMKDTKGNTYYTTITTTCKHKYKVTAQDKATYDHGGYKQYTCKYCGTYYYEHDYFHQTEANVTVEIAKIMKEYPYGTTWDIDNTDYPLKHLCPDGQSYSTAGCNGFCALMAERCFGSRFNTPTIYTSHSYVGCIDNEDGDMVDNRIQDLYTKDTMDNWVIRPGDALELNNGSHYVWIYKVDRYTEDGAWVKLASGNDGLQVRYYKHAYIQKSDHYGTLLYWSMEMQEKEYLPLPEFKTYEEYDAYDGRYWSADGTMICPVFPERIVAAYSYY